MEEYSHQDDDFENSFGTAEYFMPYPNTVVSSQCAWEVKLNTVPNRIPGKLCDNLVEN